MLEVAILNSAHALEEEYVSLWHSSHCSFEKPTALLKQMPGSEMKNMKRYNRENQ
jgi:hypothetical protein